MIRSIRGVDSFNLRRTLIFSTERNAKIAFETFRMYQYRCVKTQRGAKRALNDLKGERGQLPTSQDSIPRNQKQELFSPIESCYKDPFQVLEDTSLEVQNESLQIEIDILKKQLHVATRQLVDNNREWSSHVESVKSKAHLPVAVSVSVGMLIGASLSFVVFLVYVTNKLMKEDYDKELNKKRFLALEDVYDRLHEKFRAEIRIKDEMNGTISTTSPSVHSINGGIN